MEAKSFTISGTTLRFDRDDVAQAAKQVAPEPIRQHYVVVDGLKYPVKALFAELSGMDRLDFTTMQARRVFRALDFEVGRE